MIPHDRPSLESLKSDERGFSLIELVVSVSITVLLIVMVGGFLTIGLKSANRNTQIASASNEAQLTSTAITESIRNASSVSTTTLGTNGQLLRARVGILTSPTSTPTWRCQAWYYSKANKAIYFSQSSTARLNEPSATTLATASSGWVLLVDGVSLPSGVSAPFSVASKTLTLNFLAASTASSAVLISTTVSAQVQSDTTTGPVSCV